MAGDIAPSSDDVSNGDGPVFVHRSINNCVVSSGKFSNIARPYLAKLLSACPKTTQSATSFFSKKEEKRGTHSLQPQLPQITQRICIISRMLDLDPQII